MPGTSLVRSTWEDVARSVAWQFGFDWSAGEAAYVLWEFTGFPSFWPEGMTALDGVRLQVGEYCERRLRGVSSCARCGLDAPASRLCFRCEVEMDAIGQRRALSP